ncbi:type II toxin-antitoxin system HicB family antitoxin [Swaminathania salitolerans]|nr:type II toxin-antitoxin system HicB family antitoxin [Swaminathania salitolerans]
MSADHPFITGAGSKAQAFGVTMPDLPVCFSAGDTFDEAVN